MGRSRAMGFAVRRSVRSNNLWVEMTGCLSQCGFAESSDGYLNKEMDWLRMQVRYSRGRRDRQGKGPSGESSTAFVFQPWAHFFVQISRG